MQIPKDGDGGDSLLLVKPVPRLGDRGSSAGGKQKARSSVVQGTEPGRLEGWKYPPGCLMDAHEVSAVAPSGLWGHSGGDQGLAAGRAGGGGVPWGFGGILGATWGTDTVQVPSLPHQMDPSPGQTVRTRQAQQDPVPADGTRKIHLPAKYLIDFRSCSSRHQKLLFLPQNSPVLSQATEAPFCDISSAIGLRVPVAGGEAGGSWPLCAGTGDPCGSQGSRQAGRQQAGCRQGGVS